MKKIKIKCPAKINLDLRVYPKDQSTGFHPIKSIMQTISLFDYVKIEVSEGDYIKLNGNSDKITYDEKNLCFKAADLFLKKTNKKAAVNIYIEKNIPVAAGLAGGSTDCSGTLYGLNKLFNNPLSDDELSALADELGSDTGFCLKGGTKLCTGRGEKMTDMPFYNFKLSLIKPKNLEISTKFAYEIFDGLDEESNMRNDLEFALLKKCNFEELKFLHEKGLQMSGSGPVYFLRDKNIDFEYDKEKYIVFNDLTSVNHGTIEA